MPVTGGYIELRHSTQPDPAVRREQIIRAGAVLPVSSTVTQPNLSPATPKVIKLVRQDMEHALLHLHNHAL